MRDTPSEDDTDLTEALFEALTDTTEQEVLTGEAARAEPANFLRHVGALSATKVADGLVDPKLVLSWLGATLGAPAALIGLLVPVREAGALLPQAVTAPRIRAMARRKWAWAAGSVGQGLAAAALALTALFMSGPAAGWALVGALAVLALSRSVCSVSYKDVLGKTIDTPRRGTVKGTATSVASVGVLVFAALLMTGAVERLTLVTGALMLAAILWLVGAALFASLHERAQPADADGAETGLRSLAALLGQDRGLAQFVAARALLLPTALAPPYLVLLAAEAGERSLDRIGALLLASALAGFASAWAWGRLADRSSRILLAVAGLSGGAVLVAAILLDMAGLIGTIWAAPATIFVLMVAYQGVRTARSTWLVNYAPTDDRARYTAVANTTIGVLLLVSGGLGAGAASVGPGVALGLFALSCLAGAAVAWRLPEA